MKVVVPNILAVTIDKGQLSLFDLQRMQRSSIGIGLLCDSYPAGKLILRWRFVDKSEDFDDKIELYLVCDDHIEVLVVDILRNVFEVTKKEGNNG